MKPLVVLIVFLTLAGTQTFAQSFDFSESKIVYKKVDGVELEMTVYKPNTGKSELLPTIVFFFGGGWVGGNPSHFKLQAEYLATRGIIVVCPDYRTYSKHKTTPFECVKDAKTAMRYLKNNCISLGIDTTKIVASGGSAGGHLAASTAILKNINEETDNIKVSTVPMALILFNPVIDTSLKGYGREKVKGREFEISPNHNVTPGVPPTLIMHGTSDTTVPYENVVRFKQLMKQAGNECTLISYKKQTHGFFNFNKNPKHFLKTLKATEEFLEDLDLLRGESWVKKYFNTLKPEVN